MTAVPVRQNNTVKVHRPLLAKIGGGVNFKLVSTRLKHAKPHSRLAAALARRLRGLQTTSSRQLQCKGTRPKRFLSGVVPANHIIEGRSRESVRENGYFVNSECFPWKSRENAEESVQFANVGKRNPTLANGFRHGMTRADKRFFLCLSSSVVSTKLGGSWRIWLR